MSTVSDLLGAEAAPVVFHHAGRDYPISPLTLERQSAIERWLKSRAYADLYAIKEDLPADQYADALASIQANRAAYAYLGDIFWRTLGSDEGSTMMVCVLLAVSRAEAQKLIAERAVDLSALVEDAIIESMPRAQGEMIRQKLTARRLAKQTSEAVSVNPPLPA